MRCINQIIHLIEERARWHNLAALGTSPFARISLLTPLAGYLILLNEHFLEIAEIDPRFLLLHVETPWRLLSFYLGSFVFGGGTALFNWKCAGIVKRYQSAVEYVAGEIEFFDGTSHQGTVKTDLADAQRTLHVWKRTKPKFGHLGRLASAQSWSRSDLIEAMTIQWHLRSLRRLPSRLFCRFLFDLGIVLILIPTLWTFVEVLIYAVKAIARF